MTEKLIDNPAICFYNHSTSLSTASGENQRILGHIRVMISYARKQRMVRVFIVQGLKQKLYLGVDFWRLFSRVPQEDLILIPFQLNDYPKVIIINYRLNNPINCKR